MQPKSLPTYTWSDETQFGKGLGIKPRSPKVKLSEKEMCDHYPKMKGFILNTFPLSFGAICPECGEITGGEFEPHRRDVDSSSHSLIHTHLRKCQTTFKVSFKEDDWESAVRYFQDHESMREEMLQELKLAEEYDRLSREAHEPVVVAKQLDMLAKAVKAEELPSPNPELSLRNIHEALIDAISIENGFNPLELMVGVEFTPIPKPKYRYIEGIDGPFKRDKSTKHASSESIRERIRSFLLRRYESNKSGQEEDAKHWKLIWQIMQAFEVWADDRFGMYFGDHIPDYSYILKKAGSDASMIPELDRNARFKIRRALDTLFDQFEKAEKETV